MYNLFMNILIHLTSRQFLLLGYGVKCYVHVCTCICLSPFFSPF